MRRFPFSLNVDESTSNNNKKVGLILLLPSKSLCFCFSVCPVKCCMANNKPFCFEDPLHAGLLLSCRLEEGDGGAFGVLGDFER